MVRTTSEGRGRDRGRGTGDSVTALDLVEATEVVCTVNGCTGATFTDRMIVTGDADVLGDGTSGGEAAMIRRGGSSNGVRGSSRRRPNASCCQPPQSPSHTTARMNRTWHPLLLLPSPSSPYFKPRTMACNAANGASRAATCGGDCMSTPSSSRIELTTCGTCTCRSSG
jgi:hypothetical protein